MLPAIPFGTPLPATRHAVSVSMPTWDAVVDYELSRPAVVAAMRCGYPRFFLHPDVHELFARAEARFADGGRAMVLPSRPAAERCVRFVAQEARAASEIHEWPEASLWVVVTTPSGFEAARKYWQHAGEIVSSRRAQSALGGGSPTTADDVGAALRRRVAAIARQREDDVWLFPSGMSAILHAHLALMLRSPGRRSIQLGFPYVDTLKLLERFGPGASFVPDAEDLATVCRQLAELEPAGVYCEVPTNPLLTCPDLAALRAATRTAGVPLVVDDSIGGLTNLELAGHADVIVLSLTKIFSGGGDVMGGAVILPRESPLRDQIAPWLEQVAGRDLWPADAAVLLANSADLEQRSRRVNQTTHAIVELLRAHPMVERVYHPSVATNDAYARLRAPAGGEGGLFSVLLRDAERRAPVFYDALTIAKGPGFGTNFSIACPYTLLAHYHELAWAAAQGVSPHLVRVSIGLEDVGELVRAFEAALAASARA